MSRRPILLALFPALALAGCETPMSVTTKGALDSFRPLMMSRKDTCGTQREIAEHNSRYETLRTGKETVYRAPCDVDKKQDPKTS